MIEVAVVGDAFGLRIDNIVRLSRTEERGVIADTFLNLHSERAFAGMARDTERDPGGGPAKNKVLCVSLVS